MMQFTDSQWPGGEARDVNVPPPVNLDTNDISYTWFFFFLFNAIFIIFIIFIISIISNDRAFSFS